MAEINRVFTHLETFLRSDGADHTDILAKVIGKCVAGAKRGYVDNDMEDKALVSRIDAANDALKALGKTPPVDVEELVAAFREATIEAMACRRSVLPLTNPTTPWKKIDPKDALFDDEDQYAFAIYDTLADDIAKLLPELHQIACEVAWDTETALAEGIADAGE